MRYVILTEQEFDAKNTEIIASGLFPNSIEYANKQSCKHPKIDKYAMPIIDGVEKFFTEYNTIKSLPKEWEVTLKK